MSGSDPTPVNNTPVLDNCNLANLCDQRIDICNGQVDDLFIIAEKTNDNIAVLSAVLSEHKSAVAELSKKLSEQESTINKLSDLLSKHDYVIPKICDLISAAGNNIVNEAAIAKAANEETFNILDDRINLLYKLLSEIAKNVP